MYLLSFGWIFSPSFFFYLFKTFIIIMNLVVYNASNNELVRTKTLMKNAIIQVDATPFRQWYEKHYGTLLGRKKGAKIEGDDKDKKKSKKVLAKIASRKQQAPVDTHLEQQFLTGRLLACIASRPGQSGRADGYILEGKELEFYTKKINAKKH